MIFGLLVSWVTLTLALFAADKLLSKMSITGGAMSYVVVAAVFGLLNFFLGWFFFGLLAILSLGLGLLFSFVTKLIVSAIVLKLAATMSSRLVVRDFTTALLAALIMAGVSTAAEWVLHRDQPLSGRSALSHLAAPNATSFRAPQPPDRT